MKLALKIIALVLALAAAAGGLWWWFLPAHRAERHFEKAMEHVVSGDYMKAAEQYEKALEADPGNGKIRTAAANYYYQSGNYTKAEYHYAQGISHNPGRSENYVMLCKVYVEQDKLRDAVALLDGITNAVAYQTVSAQRPLPPEIQPEPGRFEEKLKITASAPEGTVCLSLGENTFPSVEVPYDGPVTPEPGTITVRAVAVRDGLVSPMVRGEYTLDNPVAPVTFTDGGMEALARTLTGKTAGALTTRDLWGIRTMTNVAESADAALRYGIKTLDDVGLFRDLERIALVGETLEDISGLIGGKKLHTVELENCGVTSEMLEAFAAMPELRSLSLENNRIGTLQGLKGATGLEALSVRKNAIADIEPLYDMRELKELDIGENAVADLSPLMLCGKLVVLSCDSNRITTLRPLYDIANLEMVNIAKNEISDLGPLGVQYRLRELNCAGNPISALDPLVECVYLERLDISQVYGLDLRPLIQMENLKTLSANSSKLKDIRPLGWCKALETLELRDNILSSVEFLGESATLRYLDVEKNMIKNVAPLKKCPALEEVRAGDNAVEDAEVFEGGQTTLILKVMNGGGAPASVVSGYSDYAESV
ncbi:tetratricopeptide repeat protein, partial [Oscillospiraceae bacterium OttesenSCG-928-F05]|nr:tetratricopeptide repeat protein [Oscillospiraceae bacterium OttesenSCG-928-F05]